MLYSHLQHHNDKDARRNEAGRKTQEGRHRKKRLSDKDAGRLLYNYIYLSLYCKGSKGLFKVCM